MTVLSFENVNIRFDGFEAVSALTASVSSGEWLGLIGPNGAGKSSLLRAALQLVSYSGKICIDHQDLHALNRKALSRLVALVPQNPICPPDMTVSEYVLLGRTPYIGYFGSEGAKDITVVSEVIERLYLHDFTNRTLGTLSGGERQRVVLGRALAQQAPVLLLDEPTSALDIGHQQQVLELVEELRRHDGLTVVSAMHDLTMAGQFCDRLLLLSNGSQIALGTAGEVLTETVISEHYGASVRVIHDEDGSVIVIPSKAQNKGASIVT